MKFRGYGTGNSSTTDYPPTLCRGNGVLDSLFLKTSCLKGVLFKKWSIMESFPLAFIKIQQIGLPLISLIFDYADQYKKKIRIIIFLHKT